MLRMQTIVCDDSKNSQKGKQVILDVNAVLTPTLVIFLLQAIIFLILTSTATLVPIISITTNIRMMIYMSYSVSNH